MAVPVDMPSSDGRPVFRFMDATDLDAWLDDNHADVDGVWMMISKAGNPEASVNWADAVPVLLCHGWIDGQSRRIDDDWYMQRITPRRPRSNWSRINVEHAERLIEEGQMRPSGMAEVERAKADGRWDRAYHPPSAKHVPDELAKALDASPKAKAAFEELNATERFAMVSRIETAKRQETRERNAARFVEMLEKGESSS